jgi:hypothetical protein
VSGPDVLEVVFSNPPRHSPRNAQARDETNREKRQNRGGMVVIKITSLGARFQTTKAKAFGSVFELPSLRNNRTRDKTKKVEKKLTSTVL